MKRKCSFQSQVRERAICQRQNQLIEFSHPNVFLEIVNPMSLLWNVVPVFGVGAAQLVDHSKSDRTHESSTTKICCISGLSCATSSVTMVSATPSTRQSNLSEHDLGEDMAGQNNGKPEVVFSSSATHPWWFWLVIVLAPTFCLVSLFLTDQDRESVLILVLSALFSVAIFVFVVPTKYSVLSDASVVVHVLPTSYTFQHVTAAYENPPLFSVRPTLKFATRLSQRVVVRRKNRGWDILVSPDDTAGFTQAVWNVANMVEQATKN